MNKVNIDKSSLKALDTIENRNINDQVLLKHEGDFILSAILLSWSLS